MTSLSAIAKQSRTFDRIRALEVAADMAKALGKKKQAAKCRKLAKARKAAS
jgi:hypothetical protein